MLEMDSVDASKAKIAAASEDLREQFLQSGRFRVVDMQSGHHYCQVNSCGVKSRELDQFAWP